MRTTENRSDLNSKIGTTSQSINELRGDGKMLCNGNCQECISQYPEDYEACTGIELHRHKLFIVNLIEGFKAELRALNRTNLTRISRVQYMLKTIQDEVRQIKWERMNEPYPTSKELKEYEQSCEYLENICSSKCFISSTQDPKECRSRKNCYG